MTTTDSLSARQLRIAERLGYYQISGYYNLTGHREQPNCTFSPGEILADVQREIDRCDADGTIDDHAFPTWGPGETCCCGDVRAMVEDGAPPVRRWAR